MQFVCRTCSAVQSIVPERESRCVGCDARLLPATISEQAWYTMGTAGQEGPFDPAQLATMLDGGHLAWTDGVWRLGLREWRPARKDDVLVVAVANARGLDTATMRLDELAGLLKSQPDERADDTLTDAIPAGLASSWPARRAVTSRPRVSRSGTIVHGLKLATLALLAFVGGGLIVSLVGRVSNLQRPAHVEVASASMLPVAVAPPVVVPARPSSGELVKRTLPALDEVRAELARLAPSARLCARDPKLGLELELTIAGDTGRPSEVDVRTPRLTPGMIECAKSVVQELQVAPFTADQLLFSHHYAW